MRNIFVLIFKITMGNYFNKNEMCPISNLEMTFSMNNFLSTTSNTKKFKNTGVSVKRILVQLRN